MDEAMGDDRLDTQTLAGIKLMLHIAASVKGNGSTKQPAQASSAPPRDVSSQLDDDRFTRRSVPNCPPRSPPPSTVPVTNVRYPINNTTRRAQGLVGNVIPRLNPSRTAPIKPSTRYISQPKMYNSFSAFDDGGDTQVMDSQIYKTFRGALTKQQDESQDVLRENHAVYNGEAEADCTLEDGDTGHVDLIGGWHGSEQGEQMNLSGDDDVGCTSPETQLFARPVTNAQFIPPETPALSKKRNHRGEIISSDMKTPGVAKLFNNGSGAPMLSLNEMFRPTPARSSPQQDGSRSDPLFQRPSPNLHMRFSSPSAALSSPTKMLQSDATRATTEPRETYMTMKESQELRDRTMRARYELQRQESNEIDEFEDWLMTDDGKAAKRDLGHTFDADAVVTSRKTPRPGRRGRATMSDTALMTPARSLARDRNVVTISDDVADSDNDSMDGLTTGPSTVQKASNHLNSSTTNGVQVPMTSSRPRGISVGEQSGQKRPSQTNGEREFVEGRQDEQVESRLESSNTRSCHGTQNVAVADSQPVAGVSDALGNGPPPRLPDPSSLDSNVRITQSQYSTKSSHARAHISGRVRDALDTSSVPRPPNADEEQEVDEGQEDDEEQLPSSPPLAPPLADVQDAGDYCPDTDEDVGLVGSDDNYDKPDLEQSELYSSPSRTPVQKLSQYSVPAAVPNHHSVETDEQAIQKQVAAVEHASSQRQVSERARPDVRLEAHSGLDGDAKNQSNDPNETRLFSTARTHISNAESPKKSQQVGKAKSTSQRTPGSTRIRRLRDIAAEPSQNGGEPDFDLDLDILTEEDHIFAAVTADKSPSRPSKRRKVYSARTPLCEERTEINSLPSKSSTPDPIAAREDAKSGGDKEVRLASNPTGTPNAKPGKLLHPSSKLRNNTMSASKENHELPGIEVVEEHIETPSVAKTMRKKRPDLVASSKVRNKTLSASKENHEPPEIRMGEELVEGPPVAKTPRKKQPDLPASKQPMASPKVTKPSTPARNQLTRETRATPAQQTVIQPSSSVVPAAESADEFLVPDRVLALFKGTPMAYYPATCLGSLEDREGARVRVRFDDGTVTFLDSKEVLNFDLRIDDMVKLDLPKLRTKTYIVRELKNKISPPAEPISPDVFPLTDVYGHQTVRLETKRRESLPARESEARPEIIEVSLASIYVTNIMRTKFKGRTYTPCKQLPSATTRLQTPSSVAPDTPASKTRGRILPGLGNSIRRTASTGSIRVSDLFAGMAFAVTFGGPGDTERAATTNLIISHGGRILEPGFDVLFDTHDHETASPTKTPQTGRTPQIRTNNNKIVPDSSSALTCETSSDDHCTLKPDAENLGFTALISDSHSRRAKYMQALALGLPCLSARWIRDCIDSSRILPWPRYLLPAGESAYLGGVVRSRTLAAYDPVSARLTDVVMKRERLLRNCSVLLVMGKGKVQQKRSYHVFLTYALGARRVERVKDVEEAKRVLDGAEKGEWDWLYLDGMDGKAERALFGGAEDADDELGEGVVRAGKGKGNKNWSEGLEVRKTRQGVKVVSDEFVIQSLILGALIVDEE
ncbi:hypothetical protein K490DRAFT_62377 [Saccharata proteae CBS 121410]|uniref:BRCT domain-containing protein n=1 Tax=Saccharata proteae CBS 121410 TaxID=1314787 RepID=A0A9P4LXY3_9PEZI|nr:hypothetical protein K490DRAFT_62377 [Saccharata proteae CBS 121410]